MVRRMLSIALVLLVGLILVGCAPEPQDFSGTRPIDVLRNDLKGNVLRQTLDFGEAECYDLLVMYSTDYTTDQWRITDSKTLRMRAAVEMEPGCSAEVLMEHVHADASIKSSKEGIDGLKQDSMDDNIHGGTQPGFSINPPYFYENVFAVEGFSETLIRGWSFHFSGYGAGGVSQQRLTESNLVASGGACATKFQIVYDILSRNSREELYHTRSFVSEFYVPVPGASCSALSAGSPK